MLAHIAFLLALGIPSNYWLYRLLRDPRHPAARGVKYPDVIAAPTEQRVPDWKGLV